MANKRQAKSASTVTLDFDQAVSFCKHCLSGGRTPYLEGQPGIGKSTVAFSVAKDLKLDGVVIITPTMHNALDLRGFGYVADICNSDGVPLPMKETRFAQSTVLPASGKWLILVDELPDCPIHEQSGFYQLLLEGKIGEYVIPDGSLIMGAGNRPEDRAAANELSSAIRGRVATGRMATNLDSVAKHAMASKWSPLVVSFMRNFPDCLQGFDFDDFAGGCTPRDLDAVSRIELAGWPKKDSVGHAVAIGNLGNKWGDKYFAHRTLTLPDPQAVITNPASAPIPEDRVVQYAYNAAVAQQASKKTIAKIGKYSKRLKTAMANALIIDCLHVCPAVVDSKTFIDWHQKNEKLL